MKIAFATVYDPQDVRRGSGTYYHLVKELERQGHSLHYIGPLNASVPFVTKLIRSLNRRFGRRYKTYLDPFLGRRWGREVTEQLVGVECDVLLTNDYAIAGYTSIDRPIVLYTDAMIPYSYHRGKIPTHSRIANLGAVRLFQRTIRRGLSAADLCVFPESWIANEAKNYVDDGRKIAIIPFGANVQDPGVDIATARTFAKVIKASQINLLFVGKDWTRKGGDIAVQTTYALQELGYNALLHVVGGAPAYEVNSECIRLHGYLDKSDENDLSKLKRLYRECDVFIFPSVAEGSVISVVEAAAYGLPTLAYDVPGVRGRVIDRVSGYLLSPGASEDKFASLIMSWYEKPSLYDQLVSGARKLYDKKANWKVAVSELVCVMRDNL